MKRREIIFSYLYFIYVSIQAFVLAIINYNMIELCLVTITLLLMGLCFVFLQFIVGFSKKPILEVI